MSEWGNPAEVMFSHTVLSQAGTDKVTRGTETSKYPQEEKATAIFLVAASERERGQTRVHALWGCGLQQARNMYSRIVLESTAEGGNSPVGEMHMKLAVSRVGPDTCNPV